MSTVTSYIKLVQFIEDFASNHRQVQRFQAEFNDQMPNFATNGEAFPVLFMSPVSTTFGEFADAYEVQIYCYSPIQKDRADVNYVHSDTQMILNDLKKYIKDGENQFFGIEADVTSIPMREITTDYVIGNMMTVTIDVDTYGVCDIPFVDAPLYPVSGCNVIYAQYLTCDTLDECGTFNAAIDGLQAEIDALSATTTTNYYTTGATLSGNVLSFDRNDLEDAYNVDLSTLSPPDLSGYLPISGGTLTGPLVGSSISASTLFVTNEDWTIELIDAQTVDFYAPYNLIIQSVDTILSPSTISLFDDDVAYTTGSTITSGSKITVSAATATVINLNTVR
jgi:hypothetical protein